MLQTLLWCNYKSWHTKLFDTLINCLLCKNANYTPSTTIVSLRNQCRGFSVFVNHYWQLFFHHLAFSLWPVSLRRWIRTLIHIEQYECIQNLTFFTYNWMKWPCSLLSKYVQWPQDEWDHTGTNDYSVTTGTSGSVKIWNTCTGKLENTIYLGSPIHHIIWEDTISGRNAFLAACEDGSICLDLHQSVSLLYKV